MPATMVTCPGCLGFVNTERCTRCEGEGTVAKCGRCGETGPEHEVGDEHCMACYAIDDCPSCGTMMAVFDDPAPGGNAVAYGARCPGCGHTVTHAVSC